MMKKIKVIFLGTPEFAVPILKKLAQSEFKPVAVFCAPDKPVGRKQILTPPPVKVATQELGIPVFQPANKSELTKLVAEQKPDLIISAAYGIIIPKEVLDAPKYGCLNIHPSLLPKYRGASPIQAAILNGDTKTGVSIFKMDEGIDAGPIIAAEEIDLGEAASFSLPATHPRPAPPAGGTPAFAQSLPPRPTTPELSKILSELGADLLLKILPDWLAGQIQAKPQDDSQAVYAPQIKKEDGQIDWQKSAAQIERQIRAFDPWPGSYSIYPLSEPIGRVEGLKLKILSASVSEKNFDQQPGEIFIEGNNVFVQTGNGSLQIEKLQLEGGKSQDTASFIRGHQDITGKILK